MNENCLTCNGEHSLAIILKLSISENETVADSNFSDVFLLNIFYDA